MKLSNAHCHPQFLDTEDASSTLTSWTGHPVIASSTHYDDVHTVLQIAQKNLHVLPTIGWHPWYIPKEITMIKIDDNMKKLTSKLMEHNLPIGGRFNWHPKWKSRERNYKYRTLSSTSERPRSTCYAHYVRAVAKYYAYSNIPKPNSTYITIKVIHKYLHNISAITLILGYPYCSGRIT